MTEHILQEHTAADRDIMRRIAIVVGCFLAATVVMAVIIGVTMG